MALVHLQNLVLSIKCLAEALQSNDEYLGITLFSYCIVLTVQLQTQ